jgi:hypothetical protein
MKRGSPSLPDPLLGLTNGFASQARLFGLRIPGFAPTESSGAFGGKSGPNG